MRIEYVSKDNAISACYDGFADCRDDCADNIRYLPAADVMPVVRCRDCRYWNSARISCEGLARCLTGESGVRFRNANDFCSRGTRKEGE